ncbi:hypothetical protein CP532_2126 [Ophiocordyceps camponoti-leonardi (nom. inval.)]|nr:hypothetical protein CP532_2126 [Ophiocordyceps camponoti-leonardi (nom. inval.)]
MPLTDTIVSYVSLSLAAASLAIDVVVDQVRAAYHDAFARAVAGGRCLPLLIPYSLLGTFIVPTLWLAVPHVRWPAFYHTRWLVVGFSVAFNVYIARNSSSTNIAISYVTGLIAAWGILSSLHLLIWSRPQFDAARAVRSSASNEPAQVKNPQVTRPPNKDAFHWQPFPADAPFLDRLGWAADLVLSFRGIGWNWSITSVPRPRMPCPVRPNDPVDFEHMSRTSRSGAEVCLTEGEFVRKRISTVAIMYLITDFCSILVVRDPYFLLGPDHVHELPPHLRAIPAGLLLAYRELLVITSVLCILCGIFSLNDLAQYWLLKAWCPSRSGLWLHPTSFGGFSSVLDRGLSGFWGGFWHQTFRHQFLAPVTWAIEQGYIKSGSQLAMISGTFVSFLQSGFLHSFGSLSSIPETKPWRPIVFFLLQAVGMSLQDTLRNQIRRYVPKPHVAIARAANFLFTLGWLYCTAIFFVDDVTSAGFAFVEVLPLSPLRWLGFGRASDSWLRWDRDCFPKWHRGQHWWESGLGW